MTTNEVLLGVIALATLTMAIVQVVVIVAGVRFARRVDAAVQRVEAATAPMLARVDDVATEALASMSAARSQMDRLEVMTTDMVTRIDDTVHALQTYVMAPARQGAALLAGARAAVQVLHRTPFLR